MKVFAIVLLFAAAVCANDMMVSSSYGGSAPAPAPASYGGGGSSYGGGSAPQSIPAPPCPKNYLFSCQPNMQPAPCAPQSAPSSGWGSAGAYSANYPTYAMPQWGVNNYHAY